VNKLHLEYCASDEWALLLAQSIIPPATAGIDFGEHVLEVGPGPGRTTETLRTMFPRMTAVELDPDLARALATRMAGTNVEVVQADATGLPMAPATFSGAVSFTMLHHLATPALQDRLFAEMARVLRPGATFVGSDNLDSPAFREAHLDDICTPIDPATLPSRLEAAGFENITVHANPFAFRFSATRRS
jgi:SAM-dependent methyltransferase